MTRHGCVCITRLVLLADGVPNGVSALTDRVGSVEAARDDVRDPRGMVVDAPRPRRRRVVDVNSRRVSADADGRRWDGLLTFMLPSADIEEVREQSARLYGGRVSTWLRAAVREKLSRERALAVAGEECDGGDGQ